MKRNHLQLTLALLLFFVVNLLTAQNVGVGTAAPNSKLDVDGDLALREGTAIAVVAGSNALALTGEKSHYRLTGAAAAFSINTISGGNDGQVLTLINATGQTMTIDNNNVANGIFTGFGSNITTNGTNEAAVTLIYNATLARWVVTATTGMGGSDDWRLLGNAGTTPATNFVGTTDNQPLAFRTFNTEKARIVNGNANNGVLGIGMQSIPSGNPLVVDGFATLVAAGNGINHGDINMASAGNSVFSGYFISSKARGTLDAPAIVQNGDLLGVQEFWGHDGANYLVGAQMYAAVEAAPGANDMPTALLFTTTPDGAGAPLERMRINNAGDVGIGIAAPTAKVDISANSGITYPQIRLLEQGNDYARLNYMNTNSATKYWASTAYIDAVVDHNSVYNIWYGSTGSNIMSVTGDNRVGINVSQNPQNILDVNGDLALREGTAITAASGANHDLALPLNATTAGEHSHYRITGAAANFNITGLAGGNDGQVLTLINATAQTMTLSNDNVGSVATNRIQTGYGADMSIAAGGTVSMIYNATLGRWKVTSHAGSTTGQEWLLLGNAGTNPANNFLGTTDNQPLVIRTQNTEKVRVLSGNGQVGIGTATSAIGTTYGFEKLKLSGDANINDVELEAVGPGGFGTIVVFDKANGTYSPMSRTAALNGDQLGNFQFRGYDGIGYANGAFMIVRTDGVTGATDMPARFEFWTALDGTETPAERMRINNAGNVGIGTAPTARLHAVTNTGTQVGIFTNTLATATTNAVEISTNSTNTLNAALAASNTGGGDVGFFNINNATNGNAAVLAATNGLGYALEAYNVNAGGNATGIVGYASPTAPAIGGVGIYGTTAAARQSFGVLGLNENTSATATERGVGVIGISRTGGFGYFQGGVGVMGHGQSVGVGGYTDFADATGVLGQFSGTGVGYGVRGFTSQAGSYGVYGQFTPTAGISGAGVYGIISGTLAGTSFAETTVGAAIKGNAISSGAYKFGVFGSGGTSTRSGGVIGYDYGIAIGALGYYASNVVDYAVYGFGQAYQTGAAGGRIANPTGLSMTQEVSPNAEIGMGMYAGTMGGWVRGLVYGMHVKGERYSMYVDGQAIANKPIAQLLDNGTESRSVAYTPVSKTADVYAKGKGTLRNGTASILFDADFINTLSDADIIVTVTPVGNCKGIHLVSVGKEGFTVAENDNGNSNVSFTWMAIGEQKIQPTALSPEILATDFDSKMEGVMFNENDTEHNAQPIWWDGNNVRFDQPDEQLLGRNKGKSMEKNTAAPIPQLIQKSADAMPQVNPEKIAARQLQAEAVASRKNEEVEQPLTTVRDAKTAAKIQQAAQAELEAEATENQASIARKKQQEALQQEEALKLGKMNRTETVPVRPEPVEIKPSFIPAPLNTVRPKQ